MTRKNGSICVEMDSGHSVEGDLLLVATGRRPNTKALRVEAAGVALDDKGYVRVDKHFRTTTPHIYAIGDVTGQPAFTHVAWEDYRRLQSILEGGDRTQGDRVLGYAFFIEPQVGRAGLTLEQARGQGYQARAATLPLTDVARANLSGQPRGFYRVVIDERSDRILGATLVGAERAELIHIFIAHMEAGATWQTLARSVYIHPAFAEGLPTLVRQFAA
ncbi:MAG TPA: FAD-dependent oxidoreductase [Caldilinea sp.]|nr:FAD-dependent oxidoreductase [Caldilinea sp.]